MKIFHVTCWVFMIGFLVVQTIFTLPIDSPSQSRSEKRSQAVYKIIRTFLEFQIDELDKDFLKDMEKYEESEERPSYDKRVLKNQGFLDKMRMKFLNDASRTGWDKK